MQHPYNALLGTVDATLRPQLLDTGKSIVAEVRIPQTNGKPYVIRANVSYGQAELGWFGSSTVRKAKKLAKKVAKSKVVQGAWKTMPLWANMVPPPAGPALAAGAAAAQAAQKIVKAAKGGHAKAKKFLDGAKAERGKKKEAAKKTAKVYGKLKNVNPKLAKKAVSAIAQKSGDYTVLMPNGKAVKIPASKVHG